MIGKTGVNVPLHAALGFAPEQELVIILCQGMVENIAQKLELLTLNLKYVRYRLAKVRYL